MNDSDTPRRGRSHGPRRRGLLSRAGALPFIALLVAGVVLVVVLVARGGGSDPASNASAGAPTAKDRTLVVAMPSTPESADPEYGATTQSWELPINVYEFMTAYQFKPDANGVGEPQFDQPLEPRLAESWTVSPNGRTITFKLRPGVKSEFGNELTAQDVVWSWRRSFALNAIGKWMFTSASVDSAKAIKATDGMTVSLRTSDPNPLLPTGQAVLEAPGIYDADVVKEHATADDPWAKKWLGTHSATFGPYKITEFSPGNQVVLERNPNYYGKPPANDKIILREVPSAANRLQLLKQGEVDVAEALSTKQRQSLADASDVKVASIKGNAGVIYGLNSDYKPLADPRVRQAIAYAAPIDAIRKTVYFDDPDVQYMKGYLPDAYPAQTGDWPYYPTDLDKARELLKEAGQGPFKLPLVFNATIPEHEQIAILIRDQLKQIGIDVELVKRTSAQYQELFFSGKAESILVADAPWVPDPPYAPTLYFSSLELSHANWINYKNARVNDLIQRSRAAVDSTQRTDLAKQAYKIIISEAPWAFYLGTGYQLAMRSDVEGLNWRPNNLNNYAELRKKQ